jgi:hypothetical protein
MGRGIGPVIRKLHRATDLLFRGTGISLDHVEGEGDG